MELAQWINLYSAIAATKTALEKGKWMLLSSGIVACTALILITVWALSERFSHQTSIGVAVLGIVLAIAWALAQQRIQAESDHWDRMLRSIESQFSGAEFYRSIHRLMLGEQVCIPSSAWICGEWNPDATRFPIFARRISGSVMTGVPLIFGLSFAAVLIGLLVR